ncbi:ribonuclease P protein component [[Mycoplasma] testudinis]|uniref:ribonuclease P protein component n=1 Tax=[Mycoplasma] testudinis TaxID=33924 RepID=UPI00047FB3E5|nr:ribonuclease P protein component [[Mycoplasma] testudinis]
MKKVYRLAERKVFETITKNRKKIASKKYLIHFQKNNSKHFRIAIITSKANFKSAVVRNKIKRQVRTFFDKIPNKNIPLDLLLIVSPGYITDSYAKNQTDFLIQIKKIVTSFESKKGL